MTGRLPLDEQLDALRAVLCRNDVLTEVLARTATLGLPGWYLTAGCLFQTVWNVVTDRPPAHGIKDYDVFYFDDRDLSWEAEDAVIRAGREVFAGLPAEVEIRNEARVHLWYEEKFGVPCPPYGSSEAAIDSFAATTCCLGVRLEGD
ncbi:nucleotidyltransferase family protein, partial [Streptomyces griseorubiginosus]|uniref:nucleotidyltransferase family protein n=1 Tax=Streptomyces griseorubiginosus TaxID=67304 RepID=UPI001AD650AA